MTDSERYEPSSSSRTGTPPDEFFARNSDVAALAGQNIDLFTRKLDALFWTTQYVTPVLTLRH
jgi:hypothetical protein